MFSSVGLEHLPYKQGVNGSNPLIPTSVLSYDVSEIGSRVVGDSDNLTNDPVEGKKQHTNLSHLVTSQ